MLVDFDEIGDGEYIVDGTASIDKFLNFLTFVPKRNLILQPLTAG